MEAPVAENNKGSQAMVHTAPGNISVQHVIKLMAARGVSAVVVVEDLKPVGIVTSRDIMVRVTAPGQDAAKVAVETIMSSPPVTVSESQSVNDAVALMERHGIRRLPIVDETGRLITLLALDDILRLDLADSSGLSGVVRGQTRRPVEGSPGAREPQVVTFADLPPLPMPSRPMSPGTVGGIAAGSKIIPMVKRRPLTRLHFAMRAWYHRNKLPILLMLGASLLGVVVTFYVSAFYSYKPVYYEPKEDSREIQLKQKELEELQQKRSETDRQAQSRPDGSR
jgi:CBS domain-containing protein